MIHEDGAEAHRWLPEGYPFWLRGEVSEGHIVAVLERVRENLGCPEWHRGLSAMADIAAQTSPAAIGRELISLFR